jgi:AraC-like DNA-binding protein
MKLEYHNIKDRGKFIITSFQCPPSLNLLLEKNLYKIIWCHENETTIVVDGYQMQLSAGQVMFCTPGNVVKIPKENRGLIAYVFNREFYCIQYNDCEVSCMGMLFYGSSNAPIAALDIKQAKSFEAILLLLQEEFDIKDHIQEEMLRTLLKRMLITSTQLIKTCGFTNNMTSQQVELIRKFNILVEYLFKEKHQVADYAALLFKSPKTLSNFFKKHNAPSPMRVINNRITAEAKRLLLYSNKSAEEIAYELGYQEASHFSKFFKKQTGMTPLTLRKQ